MAQRPDGEREWFEGMLGLLAALDAARVSFRAGEHAGPSAD